MLINCGDPKNPLRSTIRGHKFYMKPFENFAETVKRNSLQTAVTAKSKWPEQNHKWWFLKYFFEVKIDMS